jgi:hypothetical protein
MKGFAEKFGIAICGLITSILVAIADVAVARMTGFDLFTLSYFVIVPAGAGLVGAAAASGYYFGSLYFHKRATKDLLIQMVVIAGLSQLLIYWLGYATMVLDDGRKVADLLPFAQYMDITLTTSHYKFGRGQADMGEAGNFGYFMAVLQFIGFLLGGFTIYSNLRKRWVCPTCDLYLRPLSKKEKRFENAELGGAYYDRVFALPLNGSDFNELIRANFKVDKPAQGALQINSKLLGCPKCKTQAVEEKVLGYNGKEWKAMPDFDRRVPIPEGVDISPAFRG